MDDPKKLNGRPLKLEGKRDKFINVRLTEQEYREISDLENELGISKTQLVRMRTLSGAGQTVINAREMIKLLDGIGTEMNRAGNNINQLARHANTLKLQGSLDPSVVYSFNRLFDDYIRIQRELESALRTIIRSVIV